MVEPYRILIIEDDPEHAELIKMGFRKHDEFFLDFAETGEEGLAMIASGSYDLISVDLVLPGIGGLDVLVRIRKLDQDIPVVMVSGHGTTEMAVVAFENRATKYVVKSLESFKSLPYIFENLIQEARYKSTERKMRAVIERSERIHRNIVENALAGIYILQEGAFKLANPKLGEIFGCSPESLLGTAFWQLVQPDDMECVSKLEPGREGTVPAYESRVLRKDGAARWIEFRTVPIEYEGKRAILGNLLDITQRKELEIDLLRSNRELAAINSILSRIIHPESDVERDLEGALSDVITGIEGAEVGGVFLLESDNLVLRSLHGPVEDLIHFVKTAGRDTLITGPKVHGTGGQDEEFTWASAPIEDGASPIGAVVVASRLKEGVEHGLPFLERAVVHIGELLEAYGIGGHVRAATHADVEEEILQQAGPGKSPD